MALTMGAGTACGITAAVVEEGALATGAETACWTAGAETEGGAEGEALATGAETAGGTTGAGPRAVIGTAPAVGVVTAGVVVGA